MYWIIVEAGFEASHRLTFADGTQESVHEHHWQVTAGVYAAELNGEGLVMDFVELRGILEAAVSPFFGQELEKTTFFVGKNASAEAVAKILFDRVAPHIKLPACLGYIEITEAAGCRARYQPQR